MESLKFMLLAGLLSASFSWLVIPLILHRLAPLLNKRLPGLRDLHEGSIPRSGGIAILSGLVVSIIGFELLPLKERGVGWQSIQDTRILVLLLGASTAWVLGFIDDLVNLKARWKLSAQVILALLTALFGLRVQIIDIPFLGMNTDIGYWSWPVTVLWIVVLMNAVNLIDGLDGLAGGVVIAAAGVLSLFAFFNGETAVALLLMMVLGATFGFWLFNRHPAVIFMGDSGSYLLGYLLAVLSLWATVNARGSQTLAPLLVLAFPLLDTLFALFRRFLKGIPFYSADRDHLHHRLLHRGLSPFQAVLVLIGISLLFGMLGGVLFFLPKLQGFALLGAVILSYLILYCLEYDIVRRPFSSVRKQSGHRRRRNLILSLAEEIEGFFSKDPDCDSVFRSFRYWAGLAGVSRVEVYQLESRVWNHGPVDKDHRMLLFREGTWEVRLALPETSWTVDSDVKAELLERVCLALMRRLEQLNPDTLISEDG